MPFFHWKELDSDVDVMYEIGEGYSLLSKELITYMLAIAICEYEIDLKDLQQVVSEVIDLPGDPLEYINENRCSR